ncbi:hypothetical protein QTP70_015368 [Hemibagrus guttatus]|uniref:Transmembrane protein n=1 Tax=Hemibagrus guttatus TaxID=175788 RepID=A0AAE0PVI6_9TELE|nr:hypothetical protein QTP70_015368 [Hemibagrus guttatus]
MTETGGEEDKSKRKAACSTDTPMKLGDGRGEEIKSKCDKVLYSFIISLIWLFFFFMMADTWPVRVHIGVVVGFSIVSLIILIILFDGCWAWIKKKRSREERLTASVWLFLFFADGRYLACALSTWEGVYAKSETVGIEKWCKSTGNETTVLESQQITLKWISRSQILGFFTILLVVVLLACAHRSITERESDEESRVNLHGQPDERNSQCGEDTSL